MELNGKEVTKILHSQFTEVLDSGENILVFGKSGEGKTAHVLDYAEKHGWKVLFYDLAGRLAEEVGGIPFVVKDGTAYRRLHDEELQDFFKCKGKGYILFFDEINQGQPETLNTIYSIANPDRRNRRWGSHDISECQVVAAGNLSNGEDGTVYLTDLPTPLLNRFFIYELVSDRKETIAYLKEKHKNLPGVGKYVTAMIAENISPRDMDKALEILEYKKSPLLLQAKLGEALTAKLYEIQKKTKIQDPAELLKNAREVYNQFKQYDMVQWGAETITTEDELLTKLKEILSDEEVASIVKSYNEEKGE